MASQSGRTPATTSSQLWSNLQRERRKRDRIKVPRRVERMNTPLFLAGVGCVVAAGVGGTSLNIGGVSAKGLTTVGSVVLGGVGVVLIAASLVVGVQPAEPAEPGAEGARKDAPGHI
jgi:hypothetical protein